MPIISNFPGGGGSGSGGLALAAVSNIKTLVAHGKVYVKWTDPDDLVVAGSTLAAWGGTLLVRKAGSAPTSRRDGNIVIDSKERNKYQNEYFCDSGLTDGTVYYYKFFPYTTQSSYTDAPEDEFNATPIAIAPGDVSGITLAAAGNGKLSIKWTDPAQTIVSDGITVSNWSYTQVVVKEDGYATSPDDEGVFSHKSTTRNGYASNALIATGLENGKTYYVSLFPVSTDGGVNTNAANRATGVPNRLVISGVPSQINVPTYNGNVQNPQWNANYDQTKMTLEVAGQKDAGTYDAYFTPTEDWCWAIGDYGRKTVQWKINQKAGTLTTNVASVTLDKDHKSVSFTIGGEHDGALSIEVTAGSDVFTAQLSGTTVTVTSKNDTTGTGTIVVKCAAGKNYTAPANVTVSVTAQFLPVQGKSLDSYSWEEISQVSEAGLGATYWNVGDCKGITVSGTVGTQSISGTYYVYILGFNHNSTLEGNGIHFGTFKTAASNGTDVCLIDGKYNSNDTSGTKYFNMNHKGNYNYGGWKACDLRYDVLGSTDQQPSVYNAAKTSGCVGYDASTATATKPVTGTLMAALPADLRAVMKPIKKYTDNVGGGTDVTGNISSSLDYLPLLSETEIFGGNRTYANQYEKNYQAQYAYYAGSNSKVKYRHSATGSTAFWWERSPYYNNGYYFCFVNTSGSAAAYNANYSLGLAPAFMV